MGAPKCIAEMVRQLVRSPILGQIFYKLNTTSSFLRLMYSRHVYVDANLLTPEFIAAKQEITQQPGARFAPAAFVTGAIDPVENRLEIIECIRSLSIPILVILAELAPPISKEEMEAIALLRGVDSIRLPGTLGIHEENSSDVAGILTINGRLVNFSCQVVTGMMIRSEIGPNKSELITTTGRVFCISCPLVGLRSTNQISPRLGVDMVSLPSLQHRGLKIR